MVYLSVILLSRMQQILVDCKELTLVNGEIGTNKWVRINGILKQQVLLCLSKVATRL